MDHMRYTEIIEELSDYDPSVKAARVGSTVTIGEIVEMAKAAGEVERLQRELERTKAATMPIDQLLIERDVALAEVERLKGVIKAEIHHQRGFK